MYNRPMKVNRRRKKNTIWPGIALIFSAALLSLCIALIWQNVSEQKDKLAEGASAGASLSSSAEMSSAPESSSTPQESSMVEESSVSEAQGKVLVSDRVKSSYFDNAVFVGDSITTGIQMYGVMSNTSVLAGTGINLSSVYTEPVVKTEDGERITIMDGLKQKQYEKVYVMLGGNEVRDQQKETFIKRYSAFIDDIKTLQPDALIYVQSILPVTAQNNYQMDNSRIDTFNEALAELCKEKEVYYLNVAECMKDESGMLPDAASPADGMHFGPDYYNKWFEYLKTHVITIDENKGAA